jgi:DNA-sulfur modification-associated
MRTTIDNMLITHDHGQEVYDTVMKAREIHQMYKHGLLEIDPDHQRGKNTVTGKEVFKKEKVDRWTRALLDDEAVFGQLTWNFRPEPDKTKAYFDHDKKQFVIEYGQATLPDSAHRHRAIFAAVESVANGSNFNLDMLFSVRIWCVPAAMENTIFYFMNQEGDKADATRSKWLAQKNSGQKIASAVVRTSRHMTEANIETVSNNLSAKNPRLAAFNTLSVAFENAWSDIEEIDAAVAWFCDFWERVVEIRPEMGRLSLVERQRVRRNSIIGSALGVHGLVGLARRIYDGKVDMNVLGALAEKVTVEGHEVDYFAFENPEWRDRGILVPAVTKGGGTVLNLRNALQTRRIMAEALAAKVGLVLPTVVANAD